MRKLFSLFVALLATTPLWAYDFKSGELYYYITSDTTVEVGPQVYNAMEGVGNWGQTFTSVTIPKIVTHNDKTYDVTGIGDCAFIGCESLCSVVIPSSITYIGSSAFVSTGIYNTSSNWENDVLYIDNCLIEAKKKIKDSYNIKYGTRLIASSAFAGCEDLTSIVIPNSVTSIGGGAFNSCSSLTSVTIPNSVTSIANRCFQYCSSLTSITIPNSVTSIGGSAFQSCTSLASIIIPESVTSIGDRAFYETPWYNHKENGVIYIGKVLYTYKGKMPANTSIDIIEGTISISSNAFAGCEDLTSIVIPNSVTSIGRDAFAGCSSLTSVTVESGNVIYDCRDKCNAIIETATNTLVIGCKNTIIPNSVTSIGEGAFQSCTSLTSITIPASVTSIGSGAFSGCSSLKTILIPEEITKIGYGAFYNCTSLTSVVWNAKICANFSVDYDEFSMQFSSNSPFYDIRSNITNFTFGNQVEYIPAYLCYEMSSLTSISIPNSVTGIGRNAFSYCYSISSITSMCDIPPSVSEYSFEEIYEFINVFVPCDTKEAYLATEWKYFSNIQETQFFSITISSADETMGIAQVNANTCQESQITAIANEGYHFTKWNDGNADNPRTLILTQDTSVIAEFAINQYTITTTTIDKERGCTTGDTTVNYLAYATIEATANYGYHFSHWDDGNRDNPRIIQATENKTYTAYFDKNTYHITKRYNSEHGYIEAPDSAQYLDRLILTATPKHGYSFSHWGDGQKNNPRALLLTQDTTLSAEFIILTSGQCGDDLYWSYDETTKTISITGSGEMYDYTIENQPWALFREDITEVYIDNTVSSIGTSAFNKCKNLGKLSIGGAMNKIAENAFANCSRLYEIECYAVMPPVCDVSSFINYNAFVTVLCDSKRLYEADMVWGNFRNIECMEAELEEILADTVVVNSGSTDVTIIWPTEEGADTYTIMIEQDGEVVCTLIFNSEGQLLNIAFAPGRDGNHPVQYAEAVANGKGFRFTVTGLEEGTDYTYDIIVKDSSNKTINSYSGKFTTEPYSAVDNTYSQSSNTNCQKLFRNGQLIILRDGVEYNAMGAEIR